MQKTLMILPLVALLSACGSAPQPKAVDPNELPAGIMQPVEGSGAANGSFGWADEIQQAPMPATMKK